MSNTIQQMINRGSIRSFDPNKKLSADVLNQILEATQQSPSSINGQQYSVIVLEEQKHKDIMADHTRGSSGLIQEHVRDCSVFLLFVLDFNKLNYALQIEEQKLEYIDCLDSVLTGSVDAGIAVEAATVAAESLGLGTVMIGSVRRSPEAIIKDFNLPSLTFPVIGLCIGYPLTQATKKPRLSKESFIYYGAYKTPENIVEILENYNTIMKEHNKVSSPNFRWTAFVTTYYNKAFFPECHKVLQQQGFKMQ